MQNKTPSRVQSKPPKLECPLCGRLRSAIRVNKNGSIAYSCPPDHKTHGDTYNWRIAEDGTLID